MFTIHLLTAKGTPSFNKAEEMARVLGLDPICFDNSIELKHSERPFIEAAVERIVADCKFHRTSMTFQTDEIYSLDVSHSTSNSLVFCDFLKQDPRSPEFVKYSGTYSALRNALIVIGRTDLIENIYQ